MCRRLWSGDGVISCTEFVFLFCFDLCSYYLLVLALAVSSSVLVGGLLLVGLLLLGLLLVVRLGLGSRALARLLGLGVLGFVRVGLGRTDAFGRARLVVGLAV